MRAVALQSLRTAILLGPRIKFRSGRFLGIMKIIIMKNVCGIHREPAITKIFYIYIQYFNICKNRGCKFYKAKSLLESDFKVHILHRWALALLSNIAFFTLLSKASSNCATRKQCVPTFVVSER